MTSMFEVDPDGLAALAGRRGVSWLALELVQNALDTQARSIDVTVQPVPGRPRVRLTVTDDDPEGFGDRLAMAWTLFASDNAKKADPTVRGRFAAGEKFVVVMCERAEIHTTTGTVTFADGTRTVSRRRCRQRGTSFDGLLKITREQAAELTGALRRVIVSPDVTLTVNGEPVPAREPVASFDATLPTEIADSSTGALRRTRRRCQVTVYDPPAGQEATLFEMGIPVVAPGSGWRYDVDVAQKIPLSVERDNVTPAYRLKLAVEVLNHTSDLLDDADAASSWVGEALEHPDVSDDAVRSVITARYGEKVVVRDPSDQEANSIAASRGFEVIPARAFSKAAWGALRRSGAAPPAGKVTPSPKPFHPDGTPLALIDPAAWTPQIRRVCGYMAWAGERLTGAPLTVHVTDDPDWRFRAACGPDRVLYLSVPQLGATWWARVGPLTDQLLIHEVAHVRVGNHLSHEYHEECCRLGARLVALALEDPQQMRRRRGEH